jgi:4'-phosphopantetheinyl transferase EntD
MLPDAGSTPSAMAALLPPEVAVVEAGPEMWDETLLLPEEEVAMARAVIGRRREFAAGRASARAAMRRLGVEAISIPAAPDRSPIWPPGLAGSITHCEGYCAAAVARAEDVLSLGIDAERHLPLPEGVERLVCTEPERAWIAERGPDGIQWGLVVFSAKESYYKVWRPLARSWLDYLGAELRIDPDGGTFEVTPLVPIPEAAAPLAAGRGRFALAGGLVLTAFAAGVRSSP